MLVKIQQITEQSNAVNDKVLRVSELQNSTVKRNDKKTRLNPLVIVLYKQKDIP